MNRARENPKAHSFFESLASFTSGTDTPREFLERCIASVEQYEPRVRAFATFNFAGARSAADSASKRWRSGHPLSAIDGMPVGVKDIMETADMPTEQGSPLFAGWHGRRDAAAVAALREAGAVILGKTVTTEFAAAAPGRTRNPWDMERTPGGSSSGSAAAVAAGMVPAALGSQVVGSAIRPASFCGCYGYKPTIGGINRGGSFDEFSQSCTSVMAASLAEAWSVAKEICMRAGGDPGFPGIAGPVAVPSVKKPERVALIRTAGWAQASDGAKNALQQATERIAASGAAVIEAPDDRALQAVEAALVDAYSLTMDINAWEGRWPLNTYARDMGNERLSEHAQQRLAAGNAMTLEKYGRLIKERDRVRSIYENLGGHVDMCITLSATGEAPLGLSSTGNPVFAVPASLLGVPALSLPVLSIAGLPLGLQVIGFRNEDAALFAFANGLLDLFEGVIHG